MSADGVALRVYDIPGTDNALTYGFSEKPSMSELPSILFHLASITKDFDPMIVSQMILNMRSASAGTSSTSSIVTTDD